MVPGVLSNNECFTEESHFNGLLEYPQYTKPSVWRGKEVPEVLMSGFGKETQKFSIQKSTQAGMDNVAKNAALDSITGGLFSVGGMIGENTKKCEKLVDATAKELSEMNL